MERRIIDFIDALRAMGVRVSVAESGDAFAATRIMGIKNQLAFRTALRSALVKEATDFPLFDQLFPLYFSDGGPPLLNPLDTLSPEQQQLLAQTLRSLLDKLKQNPPVYNDQQPPDTMPPLSDHQLASLQHLLQMLLAGQNPTPQNMAQIGRNAGLDFATYPYQQRWIERRIQRQLGMDRLDDLLARLWQMLAEAGMGQNTIDALENIVKANRKALTEQIGQYVGGSIARRAIDSRKLPVDEKLMHRPFNALSEQDRDRLRQEVQRLAAQLRSRVALRQKRGKTGTLDVKRTIRTNMRYNSVPFDLRFKTKRLKPKLVLICDVSTSMRPVVEFMLGMLYELQDQVAKARSFAFIDDIAEISDDLSTHQAQEAMDMVLSRMQPGYYNTDLGFSLAHFVNDYFSAVDHRTTVIFVGDARNNYNNPRLDCIDRIKRRAKQIIWLTPESPAMWGTGDSDMPAYVPYCNAIHQVRNMVQLTAAVDRLFS